MYSKVIVIFTENIISEMYSKVIVTNIITEDIYLHHNVSFFYKQQVYKQLSLTLREKVSTC